MSILIVNISVEICSGCLSTISRASIGAGDPAGGPGKNSCTAGSDRWAVSKNSIIFPGEGFFHVPVHVFFPMKSMDFSRPAVTRATGLGKAAGSLHSFTTFYEGAWDPKRCFCVKISADRGRGITGFHVPFMGDRYLQVRRIAQVCRKGSAWMREESDRRQTTGIRTAAKSSTIRHFNLCRFPTVTPVCRSGWGTVFHKNVAEMDEIRYRGLENGL